MAIRFLLLKNIYKKKLKNMATIKVAPTNASRYFLVFIHIIFQKNNLNFTPICTDIS